MSKLGRPPDSHDAHMELNQRFVRRENTYWIALLVLRKQAAARGDTQTVFLINSVLQRANEGDSIKLDLMAMYTQD